MIEPARLLSGAQELAILSEAYHRRPASALIRRKLARLLLARDEFDAAIAVLGSSWISDPADVFPLIQAHLARETRTDDRRAVALADAVRPKLEDDGDVAQILADKAKALRRLGETAEALALLEQALMLDPGNVDACKRLSAIGLETGATRDTILALDRLAAQGVAHARLHAARALAQGRDGGIEAAHDTATPAAFLHVGTIEPPRDIDNLAAFNAALATELLAHPDLRYERYGTASARSWRIDAPLRRDTPMLRLLLDRIAHAVERHAASIIGIDHPWVRGRPDEAVLHCWCVIAEGDGHETWHVHDSGWLSGVYYVRIPPSVAAGSDEAGCIAFGFPEDGAGTTSAMRHPLHIVRPQEGMLLLFPSQDHHRTFPHGSTERRICIAFDIARA